MLRPLLLVCVLWPLVAMDTDITYLDTCASTAQEYSDYVMYNCTFQCNLGTVSVCSTRPPEVSEVHL